MALSFDLRVSDLNWLFLTLCIVISVVVLFYLFYFGRTLASIISVILRTILWRKYRAWIDIGSVQFSPLGGRLLFRDVRYVGQNQTIRITMGHITWRYWLWRVRQDTDLQKDDTRLPCRTTVKLEGLEWFVYNRGPAFDMLLDQLKKREERQSGTEEPEQDEEPLLPNGLAEKKERLRHRQGSDTTESSSSASLGEQGRARTEHDPASVRIVPPSNDLPTQPKDSDSIDWFREALPIEVQVVKGAVVLGNSATPSLLIAGFKSALGTCGAVKSRSRFDFYKQVYQFSFAKPKIVFRKNHDYQEPIEKHGARMQQDVDLQSLHANRRMSTLLDSHAFQRILRRLTHFAERIYTPRPHKPPEPWHGLPRYQAVVGALYDDDSSGLKPADQQYAKASTIYDAGESIDFTYYSDVAGFVPTKAELNGGSNLGAVGLEKPDIGNGDLAPEWGIDLRLNGGTLTYGPWTDRQRAELQRTFFPPGFFDAEPTPRLKPGDRRMHAALKIYIDFSQTTSVRLPTRESSKDWKYDGMQDDRSIIDLGQRAYGWLDVRLGENSSISFVLPMLASEGGFDTFLEVHLDEISLSSSVNYDTFLRSRICRISCQLPQPLKWDDLHTWVISVALEQPEVFLLRDHTFLLVDLIRDWTSGPPASYEHFIPFLYKLDLTIKDYRLNLYLNERNIVDKAAIPQANTLLNLSGPIARISVNVPSIAFAAPFSTLTVGIDADDLSLAVNPPDWVTHAGFMTERTRTVGYVKRTQVTLAQTVYAVVHPDNVETLDVDVELDGVKLQVLGWVIKYFIEIKENYFGNFVHFVTPNEYRSRHADGIQGDPVEEKYRPGKSDIFEVNLNLVGRNSIALLPEEVHDCKSALGISIPEFGVHLRNHDYFMELAVNVDPLELAFIKDCGSSLATFDFPPAEADNRWLLDNLAITSHRLFGPQPRTSVYVAVWEFTIGQLTANLTIPHVNALQRVARAFAANYADKDNALPSAYGIASDPDVIFLSVNMEALDATIWSVDTAVNLLLKDGLSIRLDDLAEDDWLSHVGFDLPSLQLRGLAPTEKDSEEWLEVVAIDTGLSLGLGKTSADYQVLQQRQSKFVQAQDASTKRAAALYSSATQNQHDAGPFDRALHLPPLFAGAIAWAARLDRVKHDFSASEYPRTRRMSERRSVKISDRSVRTFATSDTTSTTYDSLLRRAYRSRRFDSTADNDDGFTFVVVGRDGQLGDVIVEKGIEVQTAKARLRGDPANYKPAELGETLIRVHISLDRPVRAVCSPAAVKVAENIVTCLEKNTTAEHWLDDLGADYGGLVVAKEEIKPSTATSAVQVTASIASIQLRLVQDILRPGDIDMAEQLDGEHPSDSAILSTTHISIKSISASFLRTFATDHYPAISLRQTGTLRTGKVRLQVRHATDMVSDRRSRLVDFGVPGSVDGTVLDLSVDGMGSQVRLQSDETRFGLDIAESNMSFVSSAAELITGTVHSWFIVSRAIETAVLRAHYQPLWRYRHLFATILQKGQQEQIFADPPFLNRPTIVLLRQRADMGWRVLAHVRHSYRHLSHTAKNSIREAFSDPTEVSEAADYAVLMPLLQEWYGWDLEKEQIAQLGLFRHLFPTYCKPVPRPSRHARESIDGLPGGEQPRRATAEPVISWETAIKARISTLTATVQFFEERGCKNRLVLTPCEVISAYGGKLPGETQDLKTRIILGNLAVELDPALLRLVRHVARVRKVFEVKLAPLLPRPRAHAAPIQPEAPKVQPVRQVTVAGPRNLPVFASLVFESIDVSTQAQGVRASLTLNKINACIDPTLHLHQEYGTVLSLDGSAFLGCDSIRILAATESKAKLDSQRISPGSTLASMQLQDVHTHALLRDLSEGGLKILLTSIIGSSRIRIPRSILRMSQFVEHWREDSLPQSKVAFEELRKDLEKERSASPPRPVPSSMPAEPGSRIVLDANLAIPLVTCHIRAAQKLWLDYSVGEILLHARTHLLGTQLEESEAGLRIGDQSVSFIAVSDSERLGEPLPFGGDSIKLPAFHGSVGYSNQELEVLASLERISVILTVDVLDSALAVQNRFEQDIDELLSVLSKRKAAKSAKGEMSATPAGVLADKQEPPRLTKWKAQLALKGLNLGLRGPLSTQYIGADLVDGFIRQDLAGGIQETRWEVSASNLALSLAQQTSVSSPRLPLAGSTGSASTFDRSYRLAYFVLDVHAGNQVSYISELPQITENKDASHLHLRIPKLHAVMQTAAIEALDELIEHFSSEIALRRKARAAELASIKEKVIQTFEIPEKAAPPKVLPWIERCVLSLRIESVGVAIPLEDIEIAAPWFGHRLESTSRTRPAFLLSAPSILFATSRATAGFASIANLSAQFVQSFDQTKPEHFSGLQHATQNRLLFPHAQLTIASDKASAAKMKAFTVRARMSGAELDIDPTIVNSTFALLDLYEIGYKRFARYTLEAKAAKEAQEEARDEAVPSAVADAESQTEQPESLPSFIDTTTFEASFVVDSGIINMHGTSSRHMESKDRSQQSPKKPGRPEPPRRGHSLSHKASIGLQPPSTGQSTSLAPDSFVIPKFTMWAIKREARQAGEQNNIHLDAIIHSSRNTLYPTLLPFLSEASDAVKGRMQHNKPLQVAEPDWVTETANPDNLPGVTASSQQAQPVIQPSGIRNLRITFSLRIDRSRLEISCLQAAQVSAVLNWQSGGLLIAVQPGSRKLEVSARVDEVGFEIRHTFSPERCIGGSAQNLILALSFAPYSESQTLLSGSFDASSITGDVNFRQLQDFLCFKAVWLDRLGQLVPLPDENTAPSEQVIAPHKVQQTTVLVVIVAARLREVKLTLMLGQSIGTVELKASELVARLRQVPNESKSVGLDLQSFAITSRGRLSGYYNTSGLSLESTIRDIGGPLDELDGSHVKLGAVVGQMDGALEFDYRKVMLIESDPIRVAVTDEWTASRTDASRLQLHFSLVFGSVNVIMTTQTVPILVKLVDDLERLIEDRRVKARNALFGSSGLLPDLKIVEKGKSIADARKAAIAPKPAGGRDSSRSIIPAGTVVLGDIQLEAERLRLAIFLHHFTDQEAFRGDAGSIQARLERAVDGSGSVGRDLHLRLGFFSVRRLRPKPVSPNQEREFTITEWLDLLRAAPERNIFKAPSAEVRMKSTQAAHSHELHHRFSLKYVGTLDVSLNWAMLKQLGELLNAYKEGMRRIRQTDNRTAPSTPALDAAVAASDALNGSGVSEAKAEPAVESDGKTTDKDTAVKKVAGEDIPAPPTVSAMGSLQYISPPGGIEIHNPQLTMLGDATPPLDWFGVKQGLYPGWVHEGVTVLLEKILLELSDVYQKTLERNAC